MSNTFQAISVTLGSGLLTATGTNLYINGVLVGGSNSVITGLSGQFNTNLNLSPSGNVLYNSISSTITGTSFNFVSNCNYYTWSGWASGLSGYTTGTTGYSYIYLATGILPAPSSLSGYYFTVKNKSVNAQLLISGNIDNNTNLVMYPLDQFTFWSDNETFNCSY